jgi:hypothetical protein
MEDSLAPSNGQFLPQAFSLPLQPLDPWSLGALEERSHNEGFAQGTIEIKDSLVSERTTVMIRPYGQGSPTMWVEHPKLDSGPSLW